VKKLPVFSLSQYRAMLRRFKSAGYKLLPVSAMERDRNEKAVYLRHDVDFSPVLARRMAAVEQEEGCRATYFFLLTGVYNLFERANKSALLDIVGAGHEIGLHYDLSHYPAGASNARKYLLFEVSALKEISKCPVRSVCMHMPSLGGADIFKETKDFIHPHSSRCQKDLVYISDSCRAWRDERLLDFYQENGPRRLLLNIHPELWADGTVKKRMDYLNVLCRFQTKIVEDFYLKYVKKIWTNHSGGKIHDARINLFRGGGKK
jgi:hypothetical protein